MSKGYSSSTMKKISALAEVNYGSMMFVFRNKENILSELVGFVLDGQFEYTEKMVEGKKCDKILFYAAETTLQLYYRMMCYLPTDDGLAQSYVYLTVE